MSTPTSENGVLTTCVGEQISITCSHAGEETSNTRWVFSPPTKCSILIDHEPQNAPDSKQCGPFTIQGISNTTQEMLTSTAVATATTSLTGTVAECADGVGANAIQFGNTSICVAGEISVSVLYYPLQANILYIHPFPVLVTYRAYFGAARLHTVTV